MATRRRPSERQAARELAANGNPTRLRVFKLRVTAGPDGLYIVPVIVSNRGKIWALGQFHHSGFNTVLPPNGPGCATSTTRGSTRMACAQSYHPGGVNVTMADGSARFISETINTGDLTAPQPISKNEPSPYGVWGALGSISGGEATSL